MPAPGLAWPCLAVPYRRSSRLVDAILVALKAKTGAPRDLRRDAPGARPKFGGRAAAPGCRCLVAVHDIDSNGVFDIPDPPDVSSSFARETVQHLDVTYRRFGVVALGTGIAERRWELAGYLHVAGGQQPPLAPGDGSLARLGAQGDFEVLANPH